MTQRKPRSFEPYTMRLEVAGFMGLEVPLKKVLQQYFNESVCDEMSKLIFAALTRYQIEVKTNPDRKITREQKGDRQELIETMKELNQRLFPWHIPLPLYEPAKNAYTRSKGGKAKLGEEISDLLLRLGHLQRLFESIEIKTPATTNPEKPERDGLVNSLSSIFYDFANAPGNIKNLGTEKVSGGMLDIRSNFIADVFKVFNLKDPLPRNA